MRYERKLPAAAGCPFVSRRARYLPRSNVTWLVGARFAWPELASVPCRSWRNENSPTSSSSPSEAMIRRKRTYKEIDSWARGRQVGPMLMMLLPLQLLQLRLRQRQRRRRLLITRSVTLGRRGPRCMDKTVWSTCGDGLAKEIPAADKQTQFVLFVSVVVKLIFDWRRND